MRLSTRHVPITCTLLAVVGTVSLFSAIAVGASSQAANSLVEQCIGQLGSDDRVERDAAESQLSDAGKTALRALRIAATDRRPEVRLRALRTMRKIQLFLLPDVPDAVLSIAAAYLKSTDDDQRKANLKLLFQIQPPPNSVLTHLVLLEQDDDLRHQILYRLGTGYRDSVGEVLTDERDPEALFTLLNGAAEMWGDSVAADDAMAAYLSGGLDPKISQYTAERINGDAVSQERAANHLCFLYRVNGQFDLALQAARSSREQSLIFLVLQDQGDWATAAKETDDRWHDPVLTGTFRAAFQRLAGNPQQAVSTMTSLCNVAVPDTDDTYSPSKYFLLNDLPEKGMALLEDRHPAAEFSMRMARGEIGKAIEIADKYEKTSQDGPMLMAMREEVRRTLGELPEPTTQPIEPTAPSATRDWLQAADDLKHHKYQLAADEFAALWQSDHAHFDRLYLQGYALKAAGQIEQGQAMMRTAEMIPLGDPLRRWQFAAQLDAAGLTDVAEHQRDLALRSGGNFDEVGFSEIYNTRAANAVEHRQWALAADALDRLCLINLSSSLQWHDPTRLLTVPALAHLVKARQAREHGDLSAAMQELQRYQQYLPCESEMVLEWTPALDALGEHAKADQLFNGVFNQLHAICQKYPNSVSYQNQLAWMSACCGRQLDAALVAAQTAVRLKPGDWQTLDTLAEVHFRRGDRPQAVETEKLAISLKHDPYLDRQLKRFESVAVPSTTQPGVAPE